MLLALMLGCNSWITSREGAPFSLWGARGLWTTDPESDADDGTGVLLLSTGEIDCEGLQGMMEDELAPPDTLGDGLMFYLAYGDDTETPEPDPWSGLWMSTAAYAEDRERMLYTLAISTGTAWILSFGYGGGGEQPSWLQLEGVEGGFSARFRTDWWKGSAKAEDCGAWDDTSNPPQPTDTGYPYDTD